MAKRGRPALTPAEVDAWAELHRRAAEVRAAEPWTHLLEGEIFALEDPATGQPCFVSVMGANGEHFAVAVYLGEAALHAFQRVRHGADPFEVLEIPQLQASWEDREVLDAPDLEVIRALGLKFRGRHAWPKFASFRPGYFPWILEPAEVSLLTHVLGQVAEVAPRHAQRPEVLRPTDDGCLLLRRALMPGAEGAWSDGRYEPSERGDDADGVAPPFADDLLVARLQKLRRVPLALEIDLFPLPGVIQAHAGERPRLGYVVVLADPRSGCILGQQVLAVEQTWEGLLDSTPGWLAETFERQGALPEELRVRSGRLQRVLVPLVLCQNPNAHHHGPESARAVLGRS